MASLAELDRAAGAVPAVGPLVPRVVRVERVHRETRDTVTLALRLPPGDPALEYRPGQFDMLGPFGTGEVPISVSGGAPAAGTVEHTVRDVGGVTRLLCGLRPGDELLLRGPYGTAWGAEDGAGGDVVLVAGGIGLAPLRPALLHVLAARDRYRNVVVLYGTRTPRDVLFARELDRLRRRRDVVVEHTADYAEAGWRGRVGVVTDLVGRAPFDPGSTLALVCGPEVMMRLTATALVDRGVPEQRVRVSLERAMLCGVGLCGHCQLGPLFVCTDGPVVQWDAVAPLLVVRER